MKEKTEQSKKTPAYLQLYHRLREDIVGEAYPYGAKLPSKRVLAEKSGFSTVTVEHAYALLCDEGYVESRERSGFFVIFRHTDGFAGTGGPVSQTAPLVTHARSAVPQFPFSVLSKTMRRVLSDYGKAILEKSPNAGCLSLRENLRRYLARNRGIHAEVDQIVIGSGAEYLYGLIAELLGRGSVYAVESPSYQKIEQVYRAAGLCYELLPLGPEGIDSAALAATRAQILHTTPYRSFPSGVTATATKRHEYVDWARKEGRMIIEDDFESEFSISAKPEETLFSLSDHDNVIYLNTFSKSVSPAMRVAYMVLPKCLVGAFEERLGFYSCTVPTFEQYVLAELIGNGDFERHVNRVRRGLRKQLQQDKTRDNFINK